MKVRVRTDRAGEGEGFQKFDGRPGRAGQGKARRGQGQGRADKDLKDREQAWKSFGTGNSGRTSG